jgi:hypothetical protein
MEVASSWSYAVGGGILVSSLVAAFLFKYSMQFDRITYICKGNDLQHARSAFFAKLFKESFHARNTMR